MKRADGERGGRWEKGEGKEEKVREKGREKGKEKGWEKGKDKGRSKGKGKEKGKERGKGGKEADRAARAPRTLEKPKREERSRGWRMEGEEKDTDDAGAGPRSAFRQSAVRTRPRQYRRLEAAVSHLGGCVSHLEACELLLSPTSLKDNR